MEYKIELAKLENTEQKVDYLLSLPWNLQIQNDGAETKIWAMDLKMISSAQSLTEAHAKLKEQQSAYFRQILDTGLENEIPNIAGHGQRSHWWNDYLLFVAKHFSVVIMYFIMFAAVAFLLGGSIGKGTQHLTAEIRNLVTPEDNRRKENDLARFDRQVGSLVPYLEILKKHWADVAPEDKSERD